MTSHTINADDSVDVLSHDGCKDIFPMFCNLRMYTNLSADAYIKNFKF